MVKGIILFLLISGHSPNTEMREIRELFIQASSDKMKTKELIRMLSRPENKNKTLLGYRGSATILMAKHSFNPYYKLKFFNNGRQLLEQAIRDDKNNIELRFLRYAIQKNSPALLGYKNNLFEDKLFIEKNIHVIYDEHLIQMIRSYLSITGIKNGI